MGALLPGQRRLLGAVDNREGGHDDRTERRGEVVSHAESRGKTVCVVCASHGIRYTAHLLWKEV